MAQQPPSAPPANKGPDTPTVHTAAAVTKTTTSFSGPLPPASELQAYENVVPGAGERIIAMAESYAAHDQALENKSTDQEGADRKRGQYLGAGIVIAILLVCMYALNPDKETFATVLGTGTIVALATVFALGKVPEWFKGWFKQPDP